MRTLIALLVVLLTAACGSPSSSGDEKSGDRAGDVAFATELMHRDAALLNLLDTGLGRPLDPAVTAATDQLRIETVDRLETAADLLETWGAEVPVTVRDHSVGHGGAHTSDLDVPTLDGMPTGADLQSLGRTRGPEFEAEFGRLLEESLTSTRSSAEGLEADADAAADLAAAASSSCSTALDAL